MSNTLTNLTHTLIAQSALEAFNAAVTPINAFARNFSEADAQRGDKVKVLFVSAASAAQDWVAANGYTIQDDTSEGLDISLSERKYVSWHLTTEEMANNPQVNLERFGRQKGFALAKAFLQDVWEVVTLANYGAAGFTGAAATFDADEVADLETACDTADWPDQERALILKPSYHGALVKDDSVQGTIGVGASDVLKNSAVSRLHNFDLYKSNLIPANAENLVGMAAHPDSILVAGRVLVPEDRQNTIQFERMLYPGGISLGFREWFDADKDRTVRVLEVSYGKLKGNPAGIKRITSA